MTCTFRSLSLATTFVVIAAGAQHAAAGPITALESVELALNGGWLPADHSSQNLDVLGTKAVFEALGPGRSDDGIAELNRMDFGRLIAASTGSNLAAFRPDANRGRAGADVVPVPEPASLLILTAGLGVLFVRRRTTKPE